MAARGKHSLTDVPRYMRGAGDPKATRGAETQTAPNRYKIISDKIIASRRSQASVGVNVAPVTREWAG